MANTKPNKLRNGNGGTSKKEQVLKLLKRSKGASLAEIAKVTSWQEHSIRGFLSGTCKKRLGLVIESFKDAKDIRRYRIKGGCREVVTGKSTDFKRERSKQLVSGQAETAS